MKKTILGLLLLFPIFLSAQTDYVQMKSCGSLCFIPSEYSTDETPKLHILQSDDIGIYDNDISLIKSISLPQQEFTYQSSRTRSRSIVDVERTAIEKVNDITNVYVDYSVSQGKDFMNLSYEEKQKLIADYDYYYYGVAVDICDEGDFSLIVSKQYNGNNFFYYEAYQYAYPKAGILLDKDGKVYQFRATYTYKYSEWSEYLVNYDTIRVDNNILACNSIGAQSSLLYPFYLSSTLFNEDSMLEYIRPIYTLVDAPVYSWVGSENPEKPITSEGEYSSKELAICGIEVVSENGVVISTISFGKAYDRIGHFTLNGGSVFSVGEGVLILQLGDNRFISFDTVDEEEGITSVYKHFYKINEITNSVEMVNAPVCVRAMQNSANSIEVNYNTNKDAKAELFSIGGQKCASQSINAGIGRFRMNVSGSGIYILTIREDDTLVGSQKILIK